MLPSKSSSLFDRPKSASFGKRYSSSKTLSGFKSRCNIPCECRYEEWHGRDVYIKEEIKREDYFYIKYKADLGLFDWRPHMNFTVWAYGLLKYKYPEKYEEMLDLLHEVEDGIRTAQGNFDYAVNIVRYVYSKKAIC